jgi:hypothetical protein
MERYLWSVYIVFFLREMLPTKFIIAIAIVIFVVVAYVYITGFLTVDYTKAGREGKYITTERLGSFAVHTMSYQGKPMKGIITRWNATGDLTTAGIIGYDGTRIELNTSGTAIDVPIDASVQGLRLYKVGNTIKGIRTLKSSGNMGDIVGKVEGTPIDAFTTINVDVKALQVSTSGNDIVWKLTLR